MSIKGRRDRGPGHLEIFQIGEGEEGGRTGGQRAGLLWRLQR